MNVEGFCQICGRRTSQYTCPRCSVKYCSLDCYQRHDQRCTSGFYRSQAEQELRAATVSEQAKMKMEGLLLRLQRSSPVESSGQPTSDDEDPSAFLSEATCTRLRQQEEDSGVNDISLDDLTHQELEKFMTAVAAGHLNSLVTPWEPWWNSSSIRSLSLRTDGRPLIQPVGALSTAQGNLPGLPTAPLPSLSSLIKIQPSPLLKWQVLDVLYAYCLVLRLYNGDWVADEQGALAAVIATSAVIAAAGSEARADTKASLAQGTALCQELIERAHHPGVLGQGAQADIVALKCLEDVAAVLGVGRPAVICALNHLWQLANSMIQSRIVRNRPDASMAAHGGAAAPSCSPCISSSDNKDRRALGPSRRPCKEPKLIRIERKLWFLLAWANEQQAEHWKELAAHLLAARMSFDFQRLSASSAIEGEGDIGESTSNCAANSSEMIAEL